MIRIAVADDHELVVEGLKSIVTAQPGMHVVHASTVGRELVELAHQRAVDLVIVGFDDPSELLKSIKIDGSGPSVLVLAHTIDASHAERFIRLGASGVLPRRCQVGQLEDALRSIAAGQRFLTPELVDKLIDPSSDREPHETLSAREYQVFLGLARGETAGDLSKSLTLSIKSVATYRTRLMEKMSLKSNSDLTYYALKRGLIT